MAYTNGPTKDVHITLSAPSEYKWKRKQRKQRKVENELNRTFGHVSLANGFEGYCYYF